MVLRIEQDGRLRRITLAAAEKRNVLDQEMADALLVGFSDAATDDATGAILLQADGQVFCAGSTPEIDEGLFAAARNLNKPLIASVKGAALAGGVALLASAHVVVAAQGTSFALTDIREGRWNQTIYDSVAHAIGQRRALELGLTGRVFTTPDALAWGLVHVVAPAFELDDRAEAIATALANANQEAVRAALAKRVKS